MKKLLMLVMLAPLALGAPPAPSGLMQVNYSYIIQAGEPMVGYQVPSSETNELVLTSQTTAQVPASGMAFSTPVGCTNVTDFWWLTTSNRTYHLMVGGNGQWQYTKIKIIGDGKQFHFYDFSNFTNKFYLK